MKIKRNRLTLTITIIVWKTYILGLHISQKRGSLDEKKNLFFKITNLIIARFRLYVMGTSFISGAAIKRSTCFLFPSLIKTKNYPKHQPTTRLYVHYNNMQQQQRPGYRNANKKDLYILPPWNFYLTHLSLFFFSLLWLFVCCFLVIFFLWLFTFIRHSTNV